MFITMYGKEEKSVTFQHNFEVKLYRNKMDLYLPSIAMNTWMQSFRAYSTKCNKYVQIFVTGKLFFYVTQSQHHSHLVPSRSRWSLIRTHKKETNLRRQEHSTAH